MPNLSESSDENTDEYDEGSDESDDDEWHGTEDRFDDNGLFEGAMQ
jgi:hypothetical protein